MKKALKILYGLLALVLGVTLSVVIVGRAISHDVHVEESMNESTQFPDYVRMLNDYYKDYDNRSDHFHQTGDREFLPMDEQEGCLTCHSIWPHKKDKRTRAFYNQHSRFMSCMVCHLEEKPGRKLDYEWYDFGVDNSITRQGPYGLIKLGDDEVSSADNFISRIVPVVLDADQKLRVYTPYNTPLYKDFRQAVMDGETVNEDNLRQQAEALVGENSITCSACHNQNSEFPWADLGFEGERLNELLHSAVVGMVEKYESFYFPAVFE